MGFNLKEESHTEVVIDKPFDGSHAAMVESFNNNEDVFEGFIGGGELPVDQVIAETITKTVNTVNEETGELMSSEEVTEETGRYYFEYTDGEGEDAVTYRTPAYLSLDGTTAAIRICRPVSLTAWYGVRNDTFYTIANMIGIDNVKTFSEFNTLLNSPKYKEESEAL